MIRLNLKGPKYLMNTLIWYIKFYFVVRKKGFFVFISEKEERNYLIRNRPKFNKLKLDLDEKKISEKSP